MLGTDLNMKIDGEWSNPIRTESIHESPEESSSSDSNLSSISGNKEVSYVSSRTPKQMLIECAAVLSEGNVEVASAMINELRPLVYGCKWCNCRGEDEKRVHIIDFDINQGSQYITLIQSIAKFPGKPPHLRLTGIDDPNSVQHLNGGLEVIGLRLEKLAEVLRVSFEFHDVTSRTSLVTPSMLDCRSGEALVVNFAFQLHHMPDESVSTINQRDQLLWMVKSLNPKLVTVVEQDMNTNASPFFPRFIEAYSYYSAVFESLDATLPRESQERMNVERQCLARDIVNMVA
ncbi:Scarecrow-like protein 1 [Hibiscus syriacus]|uniref:Scarecrow-like protein 1 n=1 Tax=Hibiscus syriacus TaxID=106335 RepID=A0A6A2YY55_HIBSY|nr:Scarecrow-like protein 1 [Hibiscus syriacus]